MTSAKFMTLTLSLTLIYDLNPNPNPIPCEIRDACADSPIVINFASGEFRTTPGSIPVDAYHFLSFSKTLYPHCCSPPRCINGYPVGCESYCGINWHCGACNMAIDWLEYSSRSGKLCTVFSAELKFNPMTWVIIICERCTMKSVSKFIVLLLFR